MDEFDWKRRLNEFVRKATVLVARYSMESGDYSWLATRGTPLAGPASFTMWLGVSLRRRAKSWMAIQINPKELPLLGKAGYPVRDLATDDIFPGSVRRDALPERGRYLRNLHEKGTASLM